MWAARDAAPEVVAVVEPSPTCYHGDAGNHTIGTIATCSGCGARVVLKDDQREGPYWASIPQADPIEPEAKEPQEGRILRALDVDCPLCDARPGEDCVGAGVQSTPHAPRSIHADQCQRADEWRHAWRRLRRAEEELGEAQEAASALAIPWRPHELAAASDDVREALKHLRRDERAEPYSGVDRHPAALKRLFGFRG